MSGCERFELVVGLEKGALDERQRAEVVEHLSRCSDCRLALEELGTVGARLRELPPVESAERLEASRARSYAAVVAGMEGSRVRPRASRTRLLLLAALGLAASVLAATHLFVEPVETHEVPVAPRPAQAWVVDGTPAQVLVLSTDGTVRSGAVVGVTAAEVGAIDSARLGELARKAITNVGPDRLAEMLEHDATRDTAEKILRALEGRDLAERVNAVRRAKLELEHAAKKGVETEGSLPVGK